MPTMSQRSETEVRLVVEMAMTLVDSLHGHEATTLGQKALLAVINKAFRAGDKAAHADAVFELPGISTSIILEYDGSHWHNADRVDGDVRKTLKLLKLKPDAIVVRARALGAAPLLKALEDAGADMKRVVLVELNKDASAQRANTPVLAMSAIAAKLGPALKEHGRGDHLNVYLERLQFAAAKPSRSKCWVQLGDEVKNATFCASSSTYNAAFEQLVEVAGTRGLALELLNASSGIKPRLEGIVRGLKILRDEFGVPPADFKTILSGSLAPRLENPAFIAGLHAFVAMFHVTPADLKTILCGSLAVRLESPAFITGLHAFVAMFDVTPADLKTILSNSLAVRLESPAFIGGLQAFVAMFDVTLADLKTILCGSLVVRLESPAFIAGLQAFVAAFDVTLADLKTLLCGSLVVRLDDPCLIDQVSTFMSETGIARCNLVSVLSHGSVASRLHKPTFRAGVNTLMGELGVKAAELKTILSNSFAARLEKPLFLDFLRWLLLDRKLPSASLPSMSDGFWATDITCAKQVITLLTTTYGVRPCDLPNRGPFWSQFRNSLTFGSLSAALAECRTVPSVNAKLKSLKAGRAKATRTAVPKAF